MQAISPTQEAILRQAKRHFLRDGYKSASLRQIVKDAGFTQGAFYGYYRSKEELFCALVEDTTQGIVDLLMSIAADMDRWPAEERMLHMNECYLRRLPELVDYLDDRRDEVELLLKKSEGTRYEDYLGRIQTMSQTGTTERIRSASSPLPLSPAALQEIMNAYYTAVFRILLQGLPRAEMLEAMIEVQKFWQYGMMGFLELSAGQAKERREDD